MARPPLELGTHGTITTTPLASGRFVARTRLRGEDGVVRKIEASGSSRADAERRLRRSLKQRRADTSTEITDATRVRAVVDLWLESVEASKRSTGTRHLYRETARRHVLPRVGALLVREATVPRMDRVVQGIASDVGPSTAKLSRTVLTGALGLAVRHGALAANPMREATPVRVERREVRAPSSDDVRALRVDLAGDERAASVDLPALVDVLLGTGARIGESLALRWLDVDLEAGTVALTGTVVRVKAAGDEPGRLLRQDTTKGHRPRALLVPPFTLDVLRAQHERRLPGGEHGLVFPSAVGGLREVATVERQFRAFRERHPAWSAVTFHSFRRAVATAVDRGAGLAVAAAVLGHSSEQITRQHYVERNPLGPDVTEWLAPFGADAGQSAEFPSDEVVTTVASS